MWLGRKQREDFNSDQRGVAMLELAVILPVLLAIGLGVLEFGNLIYRYHLITNGVRDAARYIAGLPQVDANGDSLVSSNDAAAQNMATTGVVSGGTNRVPWWNPGDVSVNYTDMPNDDGSGNKLYRGGDSITVVTVSTTVTYTDIGLLDYFGLGPITLTAAHEERLFGVR